jgi:hypothetical protein
MTDAQKLISDIKEARGKLRISNFRGSKDFTLDRLHKDGYWINGAPVNKNTVKAILRADNLHKWTGDQIDFWAFAFEDAAAQYNITCFKRV